MQQNYVYVEDSGNGRITVWDDAGRIDPELRFNYTNQINRATARQKAERAATQRAHRLGCGWGCNYEGKLV